MRAPMLKEKLGAPQAIGEKVRDIAAIWRDVYHLPEAFDVEASFDRQFKVNNQTLSSCSSRPR
jgi:hypothetical protein